MACHIAIKFFRVKSESPSLRLIPIFSSSFRIFFAQRFVRLNSLLPWQTILQFIWYRPQRRVIPTVWSTDVPTFGFIYFSPHDPIRGLKISSSFVTFLHLRWTSFYRTFNYPHFFLHTFCKEFYLLPFQIIFHMVLYSLLKKLRSLFKNSRLSLTIHCCIIFQRKPEGSILLPQQTWCLCDQMSL